MKQEYKKNYRYFPFQKVFRRLSIHVLFLAIILYSSDLYSQNTANVKGIVVDAQQVPIAGASVALKGKTTIGTITDMDGKFFLSIPTGNQVLIVSFIGMKTKEITVTDIKDLKIVLGNLVWKEAKIWFHFRLP